MKFDPEKLEIKTFPTNEIPVGWSVLDIDPENAGEIMGRVLEKAGTIIYNGAAGLRENKLFSEGTREIIFALAEFKKINPKVKIVILGGDGSAAFTEELGEEKAKEVAYHISEMGGSAWNYLVGEQLSALGYVHKSVFAGRNVPIKDGMYDYSVLATTDTLSPIFWKNKDVLIIADVNVGKTSKEIKPSEFRKIDSLVGVVEHLKKKIGKDGKIIIISHVGRLKDYYKKLKVVPPDGTIDPDYSIEPITIIITRLLRERGVFDETEEVAFIPYSVLPETDSNFEKPKIKNGNVIFLENPRFWKDETSKEKKIALTHAKKIWIAIKSIGNPTICVQTALGALHRGSQASRGPIMQFIKGPRVISLSVKEELFKLYEVGTNPQKPVVAIISGAKDDKIEDVIEPLVEKRKVDKIFIGGKIAMAFICKEPLAVKIMELAGKNGIKIFLPEKVTAAKVPEGMTETELISALKK